MDDPDNEAEMFWPTLGDRIFKDGHGWSSNARVDDHAPSRMYHMMQGYKEAAELLTEAALAGGVKHHLVYPIVFCYRHSLELTLKHILDRWGDYAGEQPNWKAHKLSELWPSVLRVFAHFGLDADCETLRAVECCIKELESIDLKATAFRYAVDQKGNPIKLTVFGIDLLQARRAMKALQNWLECAAMQIDASSWAISDSLTEW
jgi:hypothetical protein